MPVSCDTFYAEKLFLKVITVFFCWVIGYLLKLIVMANGDKYRANVSLGLVHAVFKCK